MSSFYLPVSSLFLSNPSNQGGASGGDKPTDHRLLPTMLGPLGDPKPILALGASLDPGLGVYLAGPKSSAPEQEQMGWARSRTA